MDKLANCKSEVERTILKWEIEQEIDQKIQIGEISRGTYKQKLGDVLYCPTLACTPYSHKNLHICIFIVNL